jgi:glucitol/sorbitol PTS system EIIA component
VIGVAGLLGGPAIFSLSALIHFFQPILLSGQAMLFKTAITDIGPEVPELAEAGVLILFAEGSPPELAEVSVMHAVEFLAVDRDPVPGNTISIGSVSTVITAVGPLAWQKVRDIGHVVISFNGATEAERPGEICAGLIDADQLLAVLKTGADITIS